MIRLQGISLGLLALIMVGCGGAPHETAASSASTGSSDTSTGSGNSPSGPNIPANATVISDIQKVTNWSSCSSSCAGQPGTNAIYSLEQPVASPSMSGSAIKFDVTGGTPWGDALWWKQVGGNDSKTHFVYEISFYLDNVNAAQALEFNVNQNAAGNRYEYATQCDIKGSHHWRIWPHEQLHWLDTGASCPAPLQNQWNHLTWEFSRNSQNQVVWEAVTLNGVRSVINQSFDSYPATGSGIDVAFQMDSDGGPTPWSVWVDDVNLTYW
jgi:hypothetical protein